MKILKINISYRYILLALCMFLIVSITACGNKNNMTIASSEASSEYSSEPVTVIPESIAQSETQTDQETEEEKFITFPYVFDNGRLQLNSIFTSDIDNPDNDYEYGDEIASIEVENISDSCLSDGHIRVYLSDDRIMEFTIEYLPAGSKMWVFAADNSQYNDSLCTQVEAETEYFTESPLAEDQFSVSVEGTEISITNNAEKDYNNLFIYYHCLMGDTIFGGLTQTHTIDNVISGQTSSFNAENCYLGAAEVVGIKIN